MCGYVYGYIEKDKEKEKEREVPLEDNGAAKRDRGISFVLEQKPCL